MVPRVNRGDPPHPRRSWAIMKMKMGRAEDSSAASMQLFSRLYWLLWGANGGDDRPVNKHSRLFYHFVKMYLKPQYTKGGAGKEWIHPL